MTYENPHSSQPNHQEGSRNLLSISPFFIVENLQASISHYLERLGFQLDFQGPDEDPYYVLAFAQPRND